MGLFDSIFGGGGGGADAAMQAAGIQAAAANRAADLQYQMYQEGVAREQPWVKAGGAALGQIAGLYNLPGYTAQDPTATLMATPGYQWGMGQGINALQRYGASTGLGQSGAAMKGAETYGQNYALQNAWNPYVAQLNALSGAGQSGASMQAQQGLATGQLMGQDYMSAANAQARGLMQAYNAQQQGQANMFSGLGLIGGLAGSLFGGPIGGMIGGGLGSILGGGTPYWGGGSPSYEMIA